MVLSTRALPVSASMYSSTHFRQQAEEKEKEEGEEEGNSHTVSSVSMRTPQ